MKYIIYLIKQTIIYTSDTRSLMNINIILLLNILFKIPSLLNIYPMIRNPHPLKNKNIPKAYHFYQVGQLPVFYIPHTQLYWTHNILVNSLK